MPHDNVCVRARTCTCIYNRLAAETALYLSAVLLGMLSYTMLGYGIDHGHGESSGYMYVDDALVQLVLALGEALGRSQGGIHTFCQV